MTNEELEQGRQMAAAHADRPYPEPMPKFEFIQAWGWVTGSNPEYVAHQVALATDLGAPWNAVFYREDEERWATIDEIRSPLVKMTVENYVVEMMAK